MSDTMSISPATCPHCGAENPRDLPKCWMCHTFFDAAVPADIVTADVVEEPPRRVIYSKPQFAKVGFTFSIATIMAFTTLVAVGVGLATIEPGYGILFAMLCVPALIVTVTRTRSEKRVKGRDVGIWEQVATFLVSSLVVFCIFIALQVAIVIALFVVCLIVIAAFGLGM